MMDWDDIRYVRIHARAAEARIRELESLSSWQPIATAPKMRTILLFAVTDIADDGRIMNWRMATGSFQEGWSIERMKSEGYTGWEWDGRQLKGYDHQPTHWMPLPEPPHAKIREDQS